jgi:tripartite-type tricarboxylate transporter receptor subunit TctC
VLTALPHVHSGKLKVIGVADKAPNAAFPGVATFHDAGYPAVESLSWYGLFGPKGMPQEIVERIRADLKRVTEDPAVAKQLKDQGATILIDSSDDFRTFLASEKTKWAEVAHKGGIEAQ